MPAYPSGIFTPLYENLLEQSTAGNRVISDRWFMGEAGEGTVEIINMPLAGIASTRPAPQIRTSDVQPLAGRSEASLYFRYFIGENDCVFEIASVMSWKIWDQSSVNFAVPFTRSSLVLRGHGECSDTLYRHLMTGYAWKTSGQITRLGFDPCPPPDEDDPPANRNDIPPPDCDSDGWCNPACLFDPDCDCRLDGYCDPECDDDPDCECRLDGYCDRQCQDDPDCRCLADGSCDRTCPDDPDCACIEDEICDPDCGYADPDCRCAADGRCNCGCIGADPDCGCGADGACNPICGWLDDDCQCLADSTCNFECAETDPDCAQEGQ